MTDFTEKVKQNALLTFSIVLLASLALTFLILLYTGIFGSRELPFARKNDEAKNKQNGALVVEKIQSQNQNAGQNGSAQFSTVKLPMLVGPFYDIELEGKQRGCDTVYMITRRVAPTTMPLNAAYRALFDFKMDLDFYYGNYVMYHPELKFERATLDNGVASVYLTGKVEKARNKCDSERLRNQIEETAFQFNTVKSVQIYLNGALYR